MPGSSQKHVNFASPPAIPISPASYPSSPESTRNSLVFNQQYGPVAPTDYGQAVQSDPFQEESVNEEDDCAIEEALHNARANSDTVVPTTISTRRSKDDAVKDTLNRFESAARRAASVREASDTVQDPQSKRQALDVDSFKRLLLTGDSASNSAPATASSNVPQLQSDSSSTTDTASLSQRSIFDNGHQTVEETPRSSYELERSDVDAQRDPRAVSGAAQDRKPPPPPPRPRHGRPTTETMNIPPEHLTTVRSEEERSPNVETTELLPSLSGDATPRLEPEDYHSQSSTKKRPPPPPLARRKSQSRTATRPGIVRSGSSQFTFNSEPDEPTSPPVSNYTSKMVPPPPPARRPKFQGGRQPSVDLPSTREEGDVDADTASISSSRTPSASKRISEAPFGAPPPVPPPRKARGSNRDSMDTQRPSLSTLGFNNAPGPSSSDYERPGSTSDSRNVSGSSNAADILADLAMLQREVDNARKQA